jgi:hypothetical protein
MAGKKKRVIRRKSSVKAKSIIPQKIGFSRVKLGLVIRNLVLFVLLSLISYILSLVSEKDVYVNMFYFLWIIFAFISLAFFIALLVLLFLRLIRK